MADSKHTATVQMAGYLFQPDRALVLLCKCSSGESVSIELVDDVAISDENGNVIYREQNKSSIQEDGEPYKNRSKDLWNTFMIWIDAVKNGTINPTIIKLACVTNKKLDSNSIIKKISSAKTAAEVDAAIGLLKKAAENPPEGLKVIVEKVLQEEAILKTLIPQITLLDEEDLTARNNEIANELHLNDNIKESVITGLRGWVNYIVQLHFQKSEAPVIKVEDFNNALQNAIKKATDDRIVLMAKCFVKSKISPEKKEEANDRTFVKQLELIEHYDKQNIIIDAIDDFLCSEHQRTELTLKGDLTKQELEAIDAASKERWLQVFRRKMTRYKTTMSEEELGQLAFEIFDGTIDNYLAKIRGYDTENYFTTGSFHKLCDETEIGWHPLWEKYFLGK